VGAPRVVVVEHDEWLLELLEVGLREAGFEVSCETRAGSGLQSAIDLAPECVIADIALPGRDGCWLAHEVRRNADIALTALSLIIPEDDQTARARALAAGSDAIIPRPFRLSEVVAQMGTLVQFATQMRKARDTFVSDSFEGDVAQTSIASLLSWCETARKSGTLSVAVDDRRVRFELEDGVVASAAEERTPREIAASLAEATLWTEGRFAFEGRRAATRPPQARSTRTILAALREVATRRPKQ
jgi:two-component system, OmpR family, response regulator